MDPVSLAAGIAGLSLELINRWNQCRNFPASAASVQARYESQKVKLQAWRRDSRIAEEKIPLHKGQDLKAAETIYLRVRKILKDVEGHQEKLKKEIDSYCAPLSRQATGLESDLDTSTSIGSGNDISSESMARLSQGPLANKWKAVKWSMVKRNRVVELVESIQDQIEALEVLMPRTDPSDKKMKVLTESTQSIQESNDEILAELRNYRRSHQQQRVDDWLNTLRFDNSYTALLRDRTPTTCEWIQSDVVFQKWDASSKPEILWISAPPGFGKSVLTATIIDLLKQRKVSQVAYCFASRHIANSGKLDDVPRQWLVQFIKRNNGCLQHASDRAQASSNAVASPDEVWEFLSEVCTEQPDCILVLDGLDEYEESTDALFDPLTALLAKSGAKLLLSSRPEEEIVLSLRSATTRSQIWRCSTLSLQPEHIMHDRDKTLQDIISHCLPNIDATFLQELKDEAMQASDGSFLWLSFLPESLHRGKPKTELLNDVKATPRKIEDIYDRYWKRIALLIEDDQQRAFNMLSWILYSKRLLTLEELAEARCISSISDEDIEDNDDGQRLHPDGLPPDIDSFENYVNRTFGYLLEVRDTNDRRVVQTRHESAKASIRRKLADRYQPQSRLAAKKSDRYYEAFIARNCIRYMQQDSAWHRDEKDWTSHVWRKPALTAYAVECWPQHASVADLKDIELVDLIANFMEANTEGFNQWAQRFEKNNIHNEDAAKSHDVSIGTPLYYSCLLLPMELIQRVYQNDESAINTVGGFYHTPMQAACTKNIPKIINKLCSWGADLDITGGYYNTALNAAFRSGNFEVVKLLIEKGVKVDVTDENGWRALDYAAFRNQVSIVELLLQSDAPVNTDPTDSDHALFLCACSGAIESARKILAKGAKFYGTGPPSIYSPMHAAAKNGYSEFIQFMVDQDAPVNVSRSYDAWQPVHEAAFEGNLKVLQVLFASGASLDAKTASCKTPIALALQSWETNTFEWLLSQNVMTDCFDDHGLGLVHRAFDLGHVEAMQLLINKDLDLSARTRSGWTLPSTTREDVQSIMSYWSALESTFEAGVIPETKSNIELPRSAWQWLFNRWSCRGEQKPWDWLLERNIDVGFKDYDGHTPLHYVCVRQCGIEALEALVGAGADVLAMDEDGYRPLDILCRHGQQYLKSVKYLFGLMLPNFQSNSNFTSFENYWDATTMLPGLWKATYTYTGREEPELTDFEIEAMTPNQVGITKSYRGCFVMNAKDIHGTFMMLGQASFGEGGFRFNKLYEPNGWLFLGTLTEKSVDGAFDSKPDSATRSSTYVTISGQWGYSVTNWFGTFKLERTFL